jgi:UDP-N-acetylmuramoylalanine--D-glutamate ligase
MIVSHAFAKCDVAVFGLARSGIASVKSLIAGGARVFAWDDKEESRAAAKREGAIIMPFAEWPWPRLNAIILSPGVPLTHPVPHAVVVAAKNAGIEIIGDMELFAREIRVDHTKAGRAPVISVTGTNGKSTTTALIGHILAQCGFNAEVGGNIGKAVLDLGAPSAKSVYVLEVSSYQIDLAPGLTPDVSVLTNITADHIDRHGTLENYASVKARLLEQTAQDGRICIGVDDALTASIYTRFSSGGRDTTPVSVGKVLGRGVFALDGMLYDAQGQRAAPVMNLASVPNLPGAHNWQNAALAYSAVKPFVKDTRLIAAAIASFPGLPHRIEDVGRIGKVRFINDSKATNAEAAERALVCFPDIFWIAGGRAKDGGIESLKPQFGRVRKAYLIGEAAQSFAHTLGSTPHEVSGALEKAVTSAFADAQGSNATAPVVLLSPACASFDQFSDYEQRGDAFRSLVKTLAQPQRQAS